VKQKDHVSIEIRTRAHRFIVFIVELDAEHANLRRMTSRAGITRAKALNQGNRAFNLRRNETCVVLLR